MAAAKKGAKGGSKKAKRHAVVHRLVASFSMLLFFIVIVGGLLAEAGVVTIALRSLMVIIAIAFIKRLLLRAWESFEEMRRGQA